MNSDHAATQWFGNTVLGGAMIATWIGWLPTIIATIASSVALIWYVIQISESETVRRWRHHRRHLKLARLKARVIMLEAQSHAALPGPEDSVHR